MTEKNTPAQNPEESGYFQSFNLLVFFYKWRWPIVIICALAGVASVIAAFTIQEKYKSTVEFFAVPQVSLGSQITEEVINDDILEFGDKDVAEQMLQLLNSEQIKTAIIAKYNLWNHYDIEQGEPGANTTMGETYDENISARLTKYTSVSIQVLDHSPDTAAMIANDVVAYLDTVSARLRNGMAEKAFNYAIEGYESLQVEKLEIEDGLNDLRDKGVYAYSIQLEGINEQYATAINEGRSKQAEILNEQMRDLSQYGVQYVSLERALGNIINREDRFKKNIERFGIDMNSQISASQIVNSASIPDKKAYPVRWLICVMSVLSAFVFSVIVLLLWENVSSLRAQGKIEF